MTAQQPHWLVVGGIGTGKSLVRSLFGDCGAETIDSDSIGHAVLESDGEAFHQVVERWPEVLVSGAVDRSRLGTIVFGDVEALRELESITHPHIFGIIRQRVEAFEESMAIVEMPILGSRMGTDWPVAVVDSSDPARIDRLVHRGMSADEAKQRMASQPSRAEWLAHADLVIPNHGSIADLEAVVDRAWAAIQV